jgi:small-conductance mechanosensitive channel
MTEEVDDRKKHTLEQVIRYMSLAIALILSAAYILSGQMDFSSFEETVTKWIPEIIKILVITFLASFTLKLTKPFIRKILIKTVKKEEEIEGAISLWTYLVLFSAILIILINISGNIAAAGISIGILSAGVAFAMQQPLTCIVGWLTIITRRPYKLGDRILIGNLKGEVIDIKTVYTILKEIGGDLLGEEPSGRLIILPNSTILQQPIINYTSDNPYVFEEVANAITYESDYELAKTIMLEAAYEVAGVDMRRAYHKMHHTFKKAKLEHAIFDEPQIRVELGDSFVNMKVRFLCDARKRAIVKSDIVWKILEKFNAPENKDKVEIAYPHTELVLHKEVTGTPWKEFLERK